jgi:peptidoglycan/LPS O-acetylase OafA/YrhL
MAVVFFHLQGAFARAPQPWLPKDIAKLFAHGYLGVNIFFAISGFVIAMSVKDQASSWVYAGRFTLRRSIRLDPPMWMAIALECALILVGLRLMGGVSSAELPSLPQILSNMFYLQEFLGYAHISPVFWTLCFEIQFYLTFVFVLVLGAKLGRVTNVAIGSAAVIFTFTALFLASLLASVDLWVAAPRGVALHRWNEFFLGALAYWTCQKTVPKWLLGVGMLLLLVASVANGKTIEGTIAVATSLVCVLSFLRPSIDRLASGRIWQSMGLISYSVYLYHGSLGYRTVSLGQHLWGSTLDAITGPLLWIVSLAVAVGGSAVLWYLVERPTVAWSRKVKLSPAASANRAQKLAPLASAIESDATSSISAP